VADGATEPAGQFRSEYTSSDGQQQLVCEGGICGHLLYHLVRDSDNRLQCWDGLKLKVSLQSVNLDKNKFEILILFFSQTFDRSLPTGPEKPSLDVVFPSDNIFFKKDITLY
jgi:hypothetical protein